MNRGVKVGSGAALMLSSGALLSATAYLSGGVPLSSASILGWVAFAGGFARLLGGLLEQDAAPGQRPPDSAHTGLFDGAEAFELGALEQLVETPAGLELEPAGASSEHVLTPLELDYLALGVPYEAPFAEVRRGYWRSRALAAPADPSARERFNAYKRLRRMYALANKAR